MLTSSIRKAGHQAVFYVKGGQRSLVTPAYRHSNAFRQMGRSQTDNINIISSDLRLRKASSTEGKRPKSDEQRGKLTEWALDIGVKYTAELSGNRDYVTSFLNSIAEMMKNEAEIVNNPLDDYVSLEDDNFDFKDQ